MAGHGPPPKDRSKRARTNADVIPMKIVTINGGAEQPDLPDGIVWHPQTLIWWEMWRESPLVSDFTVNDWRYLIDTALVHTAFWSGSIERAGELRLRAAKFGETPEDRARLRIQIVQANEAEAGASGTGAAGSSRARYKAPSATG